MMGSSLSIANQSTKVSSNGSNGVAPSKNTNRKRIRSEYEHAAASNLSSTTQTENVGSCEEITNAAQENGIQTLSNLNERYPTPNVSSDNEVLRWKEFKNGEGADSVKAETVEFNLKAQRMALGMGLSDVESKQIWKEGIAFGMKCVQLAKKFGHLIYVFKFTYNSDGTIKHREWLGTLTHTHQPVLCIAQNDETEFDGRHFIEKEDLHRLDLGEVGGIHSLGYWLGVLRMKYKSDRAAFLAETAATLAVRTLGNEYCINRNYCACPHGREGDNHGIACLFLEPTSLMDPRSGVVFCKDWLHPYGRRSYLVHKQLRCGFDSKKDKMATAVNREGGRGMGLSLEARTALLHEKRMTGQCPIRNELFKEYYGLLCDYMQKTNFSPGRGKVLVVNEKQCREHNIPIKLYSVFWRAITTGQHNSQFTDLTDYEKDLLVKSGVTLNRKEIKNARVSEKRAMLESLTAQCNS